MRLRILRRHIEKAKELCKYGIRAYSCPIAVALTEKSYKNVCVGKYDLIFGEPYRTKMWLEKDAINFIKEFDNGFSLAPQTVTLSSSFTQSEDIVYDTDHKIYTHKIENGAIFHL